MMGVLSGLIGYASAPFKLVDSTAGRFKQGTFFLHEPVRTSVLANLQPPFRSIILLAHVASLRHRSGILSLLAPPRRERERRNIGSADAECAGHGEGAGSVRY